VAGCTRAATIVVRRVQSVGALNFQVCQCSFSVCYLQERTQEIPAAFIVRNRELSFICLFNSWWNGPSKDKPTEHLGYQQVYIQSMAPSNARVWCSAPHKGFLWQACTCICGFTTVGAWLHLTITLLVKVLINYSRSHLLPETIYSNGQYQSRE